MAISILDAIADEHLLGASFRPKKRFLFGDQDTWRSWKVFLAALFGLPISEHDLDIYRRCTGRIEPPAAPFTEAHAAVGRRGGKSRIAAAVAVYQACFRDYSDLAPGEVGVLPVIAADRKQAQVVFGYISALLDNSPLLSSMVVERLKESIELNNRTRIEVFTSSYIAVRGRTLIGCVVDEEAFLGSSTDSVNPDTEIFNAIRPGMASVPGAILLGISSPYAKRGELWRNFKEHFGKESSDVLVWKAKSREMNPDLSKAFVAAAYVRDAASARAEFGAEFREDIQGFLSPEIIDACTMHGRRELPPFGENYRAFVDPSGGAADSMTLAIAHWDEVRKVAVLDMVREKTAPFSPEQCVQEFAAELKRYKLHEVTGDRYGGEWPREEFRKIGVEYRVSELTRSELYLELLPGMTSGQCQLLDNERLKNQLLTLERRTGRVGKDTVDHAPGSHDDLANAMAGAIVAALRIGGGAFRMGLVELMLDQLSCKRPIPEPPKPQPVVKAPTPAVPLPACPACGATCVKRIPGAGIICSQCGHQDASGVPVVHRLSRGEVLRGDWRGF